MASPTLGNYFGANVEILTAQTQVNASAGNPAIVIHFADFNAEGLTDSASVSDPDRVLAAIIKKAQAWLQADTSEDPGAEILTPTKSFTTRNSQQRISWLYYVSFFTPDTTAAAPDPDEVL